VHTQQFQALPVAGHVKHLDKERDHRKRAQDGDHGGDFHFRGVMLQLFGNIRYKIPDIRRDEVEKIP
jgi:hypothetical protein